MSRKLKEYISRELAGKFEGIHSFLVVDCDGLNSLENLDLRRSLREAGVQMVVVPNRLALRIFRTNLGGDDPNGDGASGLNPLFRGPSAVLHSKEAQEEEVVSAARVLAQWQKKNKGKLGIKGGVFLGKPIATDQVLTLARIPDKATLQSQLLGMFQAPLRNLACATQQILARVVYALEALKERRENEA